MVSPSFPPASSLLVALSKIKFASPFPLCAFDKGVLRPMEFGPTEFVWSARTRTDDESVCEKVREKAAVCYVSCCTSASALSSFLPVHSDSSFPLCVRACLFVFLCVRASRAFLGRFFPSQALD